MRTRHLTRLSTTLRAPPAGFLIVMAIFMLFEAQFRSGLLPSARSSWAGCWWS